MYTCLYKSRNFTNIPKTFQQPSAGTGVHKPWVPGHPDDKTYWHVVPEYGPCFMSFI